MCLHRFGPRRHRHQQSPPRPPRPSPHLPNMPPSSRPLTTYSRRHIRRREADSHATQSSPIRALSPDRQDVAFSVMAGRMNKRARLVSRSNNAADDDVNTTDIDASTESRPSKRKRSILTLEAPAPSSSDYMRDRCLPMASQIRTPQLAIPSEQFMADSPAVSASVPSERFSPMLVAQRTLSRTTSRNFKENATQLGSRSLASPFSSRPASRASSPGSASRGTRRRPVQHSRTMSQFGALQEKVVDRNVLQAASGTTGSQIFPITTGLAEAATQGKSTVQVHHTRSSSTPTLNPALDQLSRENWLIPAKAALSRPTVAIQSNTESGKADAAAEHASFFIDAPMQISTPPRRRRSSTVGAWVYGLMPQLDADPPLPVRSFSYDSDVDMSDSSLPGSPMDSRSSRPELPRRRRRTIVHLSSDSLFSSSFNFSAIMSETERFPRPPASEGSRSPESQPAATASCLGPAFSLNNSPVNTAERTGSNKNVAAALTVSVKSLPPDDSSDTRRDLPGTRPSSCSSLGLDESQAVPDLEGDELLDLFSVLGLDGECRLRVCVFFCSAVSRRRRPYLLRAIQSQRIKSGQRSSRLMTQAWFSLLICTKEKPTGSLLKPGESDANVATLFGHPTILTLFPWLHRLLSTLLLLVDPLILESLSRGVLALVLSLRLVLVLRARGASTKAGQPLKCGRIRSLFVPTRMRTTNFF